MRVLLAEDSSTSSAGASTTGTSSGSSESAPASVQGARAEGSLAPAPVDATLQVPAPSVTLPTPALPQPPPLPEPSPEASPQATPPPSKSPEFNPPSARSLNLPSALPAGNPQLAPASVGMPGVKLSETLPGDQSPEQGPGALGGMFDWAKKLRFQAAVRGGYDSNMNSAASNVVASPFVNLNGAINYRFGTPRLNFNADLTGGLTQYTASGLSSSQAMQGTAGLGLSVEYRYTPRLVLTYNTSTSYQQQPNPGLIGSSPNTSTNSNGSNAAYIYSANSLAAAYQWSELFTTITRVNLTFNYYLQSSLNTQQGFSQPGLTQSFRYLYKPTTTAVLDYNGNLYTYAQGGNNNGTAQSLALGFDHTFNPKFFWNLRLGAQLQTYKNNIRGSGSEVLPYVDSNVNWSFGSLSSIAWLLNIGTQPSGQYNVSYANALRSGINYTQGFSAKLKLNTGFFYLLTNYKDNPVGANGAPISYYQTNLQANADLTYALNRILQLAIGYQYLSSIVGAVPNQEYNRGISYLQIKGAF